MAGKHKLEKISGKLCEAEIVLAQGGAVADVCREIVVSLSRASTTAGPQSLPVDHFSGTGRVT